MTTRRFRSSALATPAAGLLVVVLAAPAGAAITVSGSFVYGDSAGNSIAITCTGGVLAASGTATTGEPCAPLRQIFVYPEAGADSVDLSSVTAATFPGLLSTFVNTSEDSVADSVHGSPLDDKMVGDSADTLTGNSGNDQLTGGQSVDGGLGDDAIIEFNGAGVASGGPGDDRFVQFIPAVGMDGGTGFDSWDVDFDRVTPNVGADLSVTLTSDSVRFVVVGFSDYTVPVTGLEQSVWTLLRARTQTFDGAAFGGTLDLRGMAGVDHLTGGPADDALYGDGGNDTVTGNGGVDVLHGGDGVDIVYARDGVADRIDCGEGGDFAVADAIDAVVNCESVSLPPVTAPPVPPAPPAPPVVVVVAPPVAVIPVTGVISGPKAVAKPRRATFTFASTTVGATFRCKVDAKAWQACGSPYKVATKKLEPGKHTLLVRAAVGGAVDASPSKKVFRVRRG